MNEKECLACSLQAETGRVPGGTIFETKNWMLEHAFDVPLPGFCILKSKRHVEHVAELNGEESAELGLILQKVTAAVKKATGAEKIYVLSYGEVVRHVHFWI